ncbi:hypothetical protein PRIPAC_72789 [Pristionchus pacificus]|uniref:Uncharacterized protein n=1 Tax=Pristionchus pacificus TaxID=54126 RepID=A0A2A6CFG6_PRIPA|nr:hypothetical protein PRIPAC_72789 [Pristionchus pacificus]|eukprot:PDM76954.1 hypothetical protein PRIPAC_42349 [Pristionchus pacificus]
MDTGNMYPTNILGCQQMNEIERALLWRLFFSELFACQFELGTQPLTFENLLNNEKGDRIMRSLNEWEKSCKKFILNGYSIGKFENINGRYLSSVTEEVKRLYPWWIKEYKEHDDLIDSIADEYDLTD